MCSRSTVCRRLVPAVGTPTEDREMPHIGVEAVIMVKFRHQVGRDGHVGLDHIAAVSAHEVQVGFLIGVMVGRRAMAKVGMAD